MIRQRKTAFRKTRTNTLTIIRIISAFRNNTQNGAAFFHSLVFMKLASNYDDLSKVRKLGKIPTKYQALYYLLLRLLME